MKLPFTIQEFLEVFRRYNEAVYPLQVLMVAGALLVLGLVFRQTKGASRAVLLLLAALWVWMGVVYHLVFFSKINKAALGFGVLFVLQGIFLGHYAWRQPPRLSLQKNASGVTAAALLVYALVAYPLISQYSGHGYPYSPTFGLPCPTTIFTFAVLLLSPRRLPLYLTAIPLLWALIGFSAAFSLGMYEDSGLIVAAAAFAGLNFFKPRTVPHKPLYR